MDELTPPVARYEQLADILRRRIFDDAWPEDASGPSLAKDYGVSQPVVQRAFETLAREGLLRMGTGRRTTVLPRSSWRVEFGARLPIGSGDQVPGVVAAALAAMARDQPAVRDAEAERVGDGIRVRMTIESAELDGAMIAALPIAKQALRPFPVVVMSAAEERPA